MSASGGINSSQAPKKEKRKLNKFLFDIVNELSLDEFKIYTNFPVVMQRALIDTAAPSEHNRLDYYIKQHYRKNRPTERFWLKGGFASLKLTENFYESETAGRIFDKLFGIKKCTVDLIDFRNVPASSKIESNYGSGIPKIDSTTGEHPTSSNQGIFPPKRRIKYPRKGMDRSAGPSGIASYVAASKNADQQIPISPSAEGFNEEIYVSSSESPIEIPDYKKSDDNALVSPDNQEIENIQKLKPTVIILSDVTLMSPIKITSTPKRIRIEPLTELKVNRMPVEQNEITPLADPKKDSSDVSTKPPGENKPEDKVKEPVQVPTQAISVTPPKKTKPKIGPKSKMLSNSKLVEKTNEHVLSSKSLAVNQPVIKDLSQGSPSKDKIQGAINEPQIGMISNEPLRTAQQEPPARIEYIHWAVNIPLIPKDIVQNTAIIPPENQALQESNNPSHQPSKNSALIQSVTKDESSIFKAKTSTSIKNPVQQLVDPKKLLQQSPDNEPLTIQNINQRKEKLKEPSPVPKQANSGVVSKRKNGSKSKLKSASKSKFDDESKDYNAQPHTSKSLSINPLAVFTKELPSSTNKIHGVVIEPLNKDGSGPNEISLGSPKTTGTESRKQQTSSQQPSKIAPSPSTPLIPEEKVVEEPTSESKPKPKPKIGPKSRVRRSSSDNIDSSQLQLASSSKNIDVDVVSKTRNECYITSVPCGECEKVKQKIGLHSNIQQRLNLLSSGIDTSTEQQLSLQGQIHTVVTPAENLVANETSDIFESPKNVHKSPRKIRKPSSELFESQKDIQSGESPKNIHKPSEGFHKSPRQDLELSKDIMESPKDIYESPENVYKSPRAVRKSARNSNQSPRYSYQSPRKSNQSPIKSNQSPIASNQSPIGNNQSPRGNNQPPRGNNQSPRGTNQSPSNSNQSPRDNLESLGSLRQSVRQTFEAQLPQIKEQFEKFVATSELSTLSVRNFWYAFIKSEYEHDSSAAETQLSSGAVNVDADKNQSPTVLNPNQVDECAVDYRAIEIKLEKMFDEGNESNSSDVEFIPNDPNENDPIEILEDSTQTLMENLLFDGKNTEDHSIVPFAMPQQPIGSSSKPGSSVPSAAKRFLTALPQINNKKRNYPPLVIVEEQQQKISPTDLPNYDFSQQRESPVENYEIEDSSMTVSQIQRYDLLNKENTIFLSSQLENYEFNAGKQNDPKSAPVLMEKNQPVACKRPASPILSVLPYKRRKANQIRRELHWKIMTTRSIIFKPIRENVFSVELQLRNNFDTFHIQNQQSIKRLLHLTDTDWKNVVNVLKALKGYDFSNLSTVPQELDVLRRVMNCFVRSIPLFVRSRIQFTDFMGHCLEVTEPTPLTNNSSNSAIDPNILKRMTEFKKSLNKQ